VFVGTGSPGRRVLPPGRAGPLEHRLV